MKSEFSESEQKRIRKRVIRRFVIVGLGVTALFFAIDSYIKSNNIEVKDPLKANETELLSESPKNQLQKIDSAKLANQKFLQLSPEKQIELLTAELQNENLSKTQTADLEAQILQIKQLEFERNHISLPEKSNSKLITHVKKDMKYPESFEHVETSFTYEKEKVVASMVYRGKNAIGDEAVERAIGTFDYDGNLISFAAEKIE